MNILYWFVLLFAVCLSGCNRYPGWQYVRIESAVPYENCEYKIQGSCSGPAGHCYNQYRQKAITYGANTVVMTEIKEGNQDVVETYFVGNSAISQSSGAVPTITGLADYYYCPPRDKTRPYRAGSDQDN